MKQAKRNIKQIKNVKCQMLRTEAHQHEARPSGSRPAAYYLLKIIIPLFVICSFVIGHYSFAEAKEYDGIWFMGFNNQRGVFANPKARQAVNQTLKKSYIAKEMVSAETVPISIVPPGMLGYDPDLDPVLYDIKEAKQLMQQAGYPMNDKRIKNISLLHTDGLLTVKIAKEIKNNLRDIGIKVNLVEINYQEQEKWIKELDSGKHDLFLMGYKADVYKLFTDEANAQDDSYSLLEPLFASNGEANFTGYSNKEVDKLLDQLSNINEALKSERHIKLKKINQTLYKDLPVVVLFYIEKL